MIESINDVAVATLALLDGLREVVVEIADYGRVTGLADEYEQIVNDAHALIGTLRSRAFKLKRRVGSYQEARAASFALAKAQMETPVEIADPVGVPRASSADLPLAYEVYWRKEGV